MLAVLDPQYGEALRKSNLLFSRYHRAVQVSLLQIPAAPMCFSPTILIISLDVERFALKYRLLSTSILITLSAT